MIPTAFSVSEHVQTLFIQWHILLCKTFFKRNRVIKINTRKRCQGCDNTGKQKIIIDILLVFNILNFIFPLGFPLILTIDKLAPPPSFIPPFPSFAADPGAISLCLFRNTFIWLRNGSSFWYFPIFVGPRSVAGFRWNGRFWTIFGIDTRRIVSFVCF